MSGIEILGIAASLIQIAELGCRLSVKLCVFSRKIKSADKTIDSISQEISATGAVLQQLGSELSKDENAELCSNEALATTRKLVDNCMSVFTELESSLDGCSPGSNSLVSAWKQRVKFPFLEAQIEVLRSNLERLKSSLLVMLTVLVFAALVRSHRGIEVLKDHRALVETLIEEKNASERRYQQAQKHTSFNFCSFIAGGDDGGGSDGPPRRGWIERVAIRFHLDGLKYRAEEIQHHGAAVQSLLAEVDAFNRQIGYDFRDKLQGGILGAHWEQWAPLRQLYGEQVLLDAISEYPEVVRYWLSRLERETANLGTDSHVIMPIEKIRNSARKPHQAYSLSSPSQHSYLGAGQSGNHALQDYQMQLRELEKQNKNGLMMARQEQDSASSIQIAAHDASVVQYTHSHSKTERRYFDSTLDIGGDFGLEPDEHQIAPIGSDESSCEERGWPLFIESGQSVKDQTRTVENKREAGEESVVMAINKQQEMSAAVCMQDDDDPWTSGRYLSQVDDVEHVDSYNMIGAEDMEDDSMYVETGGPSSSDLSMLSSHCGSSFLQRTNSVTASQFINGIGAAFANQFRPLTAPPADYPDTRTRQTCQPHLITPRIDAPEVLGYPSDFDDYIARWTRLSDFEYANTAT
ncbi:hypothetical protein LTR72_005187 [Exophiala xenobiotica]|nr:hypothetical protein LTR72_005187 [Exophiala xenobiotica]KAK5281675.1 hypothetical protein LTR40_004454 [Exophiala xenobiotica]KAK5289202.1 hypothetical protein LTR14_007453 [Exophiala xenobiotica]KAK5373583.1 hypothetical protein LTS13_005782 [Exophiala xenobiotica]KAK5402263.1 hypothetical protein LTR79_000991 [Exophiala xenobiotica]